MEDEVQMMRRLLETYIEESEADDGSPSLGEFVYWLIHRGNVYIVDGDSSAS